MALNKATATTTNETALTAQDITDIKTALEVLSNLQEVISGGNTYGNANQTFTFNDDSIQFRDTLNDVGFNLQANLLRFTDGTGNETGKGGLNNEVIFIESIGTNFLASVIADALTGNHFYTLPDKSITFAGLSDITIESNPTGITGASAIDNVIEISQANYDAIVTKDPNVLYVING